MAQKKRYAKRYAKKYAKKYARGGRKSSAVSSAVKTYVKRTLHTNIENKCVQVNPGPVGFGNVLESPDFGAFPMAPLSLYWSIAQGVGQGNRVGNTIRIRKTYLNYVLRPLGYDVTTNPSPQPVEVRLMLGYVKNTPCFAPISGDINQLFQSGNSAIAPVGNLKDIISVYNKDYWVIKKSWTHKLGFANYGGTGTNPSFQSHSNNDFKLNHVARIDITKMMPKTCVFNDTSATTNTKNLFFMQYAVHSSGSTSGATVLTATIDYWVDFHYEDA